MGAKNRRCDICGKRRRFDRRHHTRDGWRMLAYNVRKCPVCRGKACLGRSWGPGKAARRRQKEEKPA